MIPTTSSPTHSPVWRPEVRRLILVRLHAQAELAARQHSLDDPFVVIKEPDGSHGADVVMSILSRSRMIFQLRDGRDVIDSILHAHTGGGWLTEPGAPGRTPMKSGRLGFVRQQSRLWVNRTLAVQRAYDSHPPRLRIAIRYEDLRADSMGTLRPLVDWLGVERSDKELKRPSPRSPSRPIPPGRRARRRR